jgi:pimeloyl-ACP methyl ester carboxylesterase
MIVQEIIKLAPEIVNKLILFGTGSIGDIPGRFEPIDVSRERLKKDGVKSTANRIAKTWFVDGDKAKNFYLCEEAYQNINQETGDSGLVAMKNWKGIDNLKNINQDTLIIWGDLDKAYNYEQVKTLNENIPNSKLEIIKGCSHNAHLEKIDEFNNLVLNFLK